jgi:membrane protein YqaA with SNARE-associated domain
MNLDILIQAFTSRLLPIYSEVTLGAIRHFKFEEYPANAAIAAIGGLAAAAVLYAIGVWLRRNSGRGLRPCAAQRANCCRGCWCFRPRRWGALSSSPLRFFG